MSDIKRTPLHFPVPPAPAAPVLPPAPSTPAYRPVMPPAPNDRRVSVPITIKPTPGKR